MPTVKKILQDYLHLVKADGLCNSEIECGCSIDDICMIDGINEECVPARIGMDGETFFPIDAEKTSNPDDGIVSPRGGETLAPPTASV